MKQLRPIVRISDDHLRAINAIITESRATRHMAAVEAVSRERWEGEAETWAARALPDPARIRRELETARAKAMPRQPAARPRPTRTPTPPPTIGGCGGREAAGAPTRAPPPSLPRGRGSHEAAGTGGGRGGRSTSYSYSSYSDSRSPSPPPLARKGQRQRSSGGREGRSPSRGRRGHTRRHTGSSRDHEGAGAQGGGHQLQGKGDGGSKGSRPKHKHDRKGHEKGKGGQGGLSRKGRGGCGGRKGDGDVAKDVKRRSAAARMVRQRASDEKFAAWVQRTPFKCECGPHRFPQTVMHLIFSGTLRRTTFLGIH